MIKSISAPVHTILLEEHVRSVRKDTMDLIVTHAQNTLLIIFSVEPVEFAMTDLKGKEDAFVEILVMTH